MASMWRWEDREAGALLPFWRQDSVSGLPQIPQPRFCTPPHQMQRGRSAVLLPTWPDHPLPSGHGSPTSLCIGEASGASQARACLRPTTSPLSLRCRASPEP